MTSSPVSTQSCVIEFTDDGILRFGFFDDLLIDVDDIKEIASVVQSMVDGKDVPMLIVTGERVGTTRAARNYSLKEERDYSVAEAIIITSLPTRIAAKFYYTIYSPNHPYQIFDTEEEGVAWLKENFMA